MAQCEGTTNSGTRCRRQAGEGSSLCVSHGKKQATGPEAEDTAKKKTASKKAGDEQRARKKHPLENAAMVGLVAIGLLVLRRVIRLF